MVERGPTSQPMERVKMLNMREDALLKRHLDTISSLEKKQLNVIAKDTINLRMELRAHRFRAMKTTVRQKGALQEFDEKWRKRKLAMARQEQLSFDADGTESEQSGRRSASVYDRLYQTAGAGYMCPAPPAPFQRPPSSKLGRPPTQQPPPGHTQEVGSRSPSSGSSSPRRLLERRTSEQPSRNIQSPATSEPALRFGRHQQQSPLPERHLASSSRGATSSSMSHRPSIVKPHPPPGAARRSSTALPSYRRPSTIQRTPTGKQKDYLETLLQSIAGGKDRKKMSGERGGADAGALLTKLEGMQFNEYTDGTMAMEMRRLKRKSVANGGSFPRPSHNPSRHTSTSGAPPAPSRPARLHTAPPALGVSERKQAKMAAAIAAATTWRPPMMKAWKGKSSKHDSDKSLADENEGLMKLHREGQRQEYEEVLRRVNRFLGKPNRGTSFLPRDKLSREETILLNKVRPPRTRLKGAVKLVMFLNKTGGGLKALMGGLGAAKNSTPVAPLPEVK